MENEKGRIPPLNILSFESLLKNLKFLEKNSSTLTTQRMLNMTKGQFNAIENREDKDCSLRSAVAYERFVKYCNFKDIDANDFFTREYKELEVA